MSNHPKPQDHEHANFPHEDKIPDGARDAVESFLQLRERAAEALEAHGTALRSLDQAIKDDRAGLDEHIVGGGSSVTFGYPATNAAQDAIKHASADRESLQRLLGEAYLKAAHTLLVHTDEGIATAQADIVATAQRYSDAIATTEQARRDYLAAIGLRFFWSHLTEQGECMANTGTNDQVITARGPITKVDSTTFTLMRLDAQTHERMTDKQDRLNMW
jgi:hypothetical protein